MTDLSIFTNKNENGIKLSDRLNTVLTNAQYFDALVGYFRLTGFYLLSEKLEDVQEIRILIGLGTEKKTVDLLSGLEATYEIKEKVADEFKSSDDSIEVENGVNKFIEWVQSGKLKVRMCYEHNVHAKIYVIRKNPQIVPDQFGNLITGSSNFSYNGLDKNIEFNVELKNRNDVQYALDFFDELWNESREVTYDICDAVKTKTWMNESITPYELYLKTLYTYFEEEINGYLDNYEWPDDYLKLKYQEDAVTQAKKIMLKHGGVLISDVVGLGKTYISAMLGKTLEGRKLFIVPPLVKDNWESVLEDFNYSMKDKVVSSGIIDQIVDWDDIDDYKYIFVDEAHRFRNASSIEFEYLKRICFNKGVVLITATPQNNSISDIANLITLFQDSKQSSVMPDCPDLNAYFAEKKNKLLSAKGTDDYDLVIKQVANDIRDNVLRHVLIRRTRSEIKKYYKEDLDKQGLVFPTLHDPEPLTYMYDDEMESAFNETVDLLKEMTYARFSPLLYLKDKSLIGSNKARQENMKGFIKTMLIKRLESSIFAFNQSIDRLRKGTEEFIALYNTGRIPVGALSKKESMLELANMTDEEYEFYVELKAFDSFVPNDFSTKFIANVKKDDEILKKICDLWSRFDLQKRDPKYDELVTKINSISEKQKIIIFSEAADTVQYLANRLQNDFGETVIDFTGDDNHKKKRYIEYNFDPKYSSKQIDDKRILVTTDALSEGVNLHIASVLINYDLPWNPTRVMQRTGRINRVSSKNTDLYVCNFFPRANVKEHLSLEDAIKAKVQMFHDLLGEDTRIITEDENIESYGLYNFLMMANKTPEEEEMASSSLQMSYLQKINNVKENYRVLFDKIVDLPVKIRTAKVGKTNGMVTFIRQGLIKKFIYSDDNTTQEIDFETAMALIEAKMTEKPVALPEDYYQKLEKNKMFFADIIAESILRKVGSSAKESINEKKTKNYVRFLLKYPGLPQKSIDFLNQLSRAMQRGTLTSKMYRDIIVTIGDEKDPKKIVLLIESVVEPVYLKERTNYLLVDSLKSEEVVVLSECLVEV